MSFVLLGFFMPFVLLGLSSMLRLRKKTKQESFFQVFLLTHCYSSSNNVIIFSRRMFKSVLRNFREVMHKCITSLEVFFPECPLISYEYIESLSLWLVIFCTVLQTVFSYMILVWWPRTHFPIYSVLFWNILYSLCEKTAFPQAIVHWLSFYLNLNKIVTVI